MQEVQEVRKARKRRHRAEAYIIILLGTLALGAVFLVFITGTAKEWDWFGQTQGASIEEITVDPGRFDGRVVKVTGKLEKVLGPASLSLEAAGAGQGPGILVVGRKVMAVDTAAGDGEDVLLQVTGRVRILRQQNMEELGLRSGDPDQHVRAGLPFILAKEMERLPG